MDVGKSERDRQQTDRVDAFNVFFHMVSKVFVKRHWLYIPFFKSDSTCMFLVNGTKCQIHFKSFVGCNGSNDSPVLEKERNLIISDCF